MKIFCLAINQSALASYWGVNRWPSFEEEKRTSRTRAQGRRWKLLQAPLMATLPKLDSGLRRNDGTTDFAHKGAT